MFTFHHTKMTLSCSCLCLLRRLEKVLATEVMAKQRWKAIRLKQKFDRNRSQSTATTLECKRVFRECFCPANSKRGQ